MALVKKIFDFYLQSQKLCLPLPLPNCTTCVRDTYINYANSTAYPCVPICFAGSAVWRLKGGTPSLYLSVTELSECKCQTARKSVVARSIVGFLHSYLHTQHRTRTQVVRGGILQKISQHFQRIIAMVSHQGRILTSILHPCWLYINPIIN